MRGTDRETGKLFSYAPESLVPRDHPLRAIRALVNAALDRLSPTFARMYAEEGRPSIATVARAAAAGAVHHPIRTATGAADLQPAVPLVHRAGDGRTGLGRKASRPTEFGKLVKLHEAENQIIVDY
jgi:hypothetical protein